VIAQASDLLLRTALAVALHWWDAAGAYKGLLHEQDVCGGGGAWLPRP
jgi:hypothetical protein